MFVLADANNFYVSCERVFNPAITGRPVVVLSNNDGCVISRSNEAKALDIKMGVPVSEIKDIIRKNKVAIFSSNYTLYGDLSQRVMYTLSQFAPKTEVYSIDEIFLDFSGLQVDFKSYGQKMVKTVTKNTGIPVCAGIAPTKTLAKLANRFAKKYPKYNGVCIIDTDAKRLKALQQTEIGDIWGIGRQHAKKLNANGVFTAFDFIQMPRQWVRKNMTIVGERLWQELNGESCLDIETLIPSNKQICKANGFGKLISDYNTLAEAVSTYATTCALKLRKQKSLAVSIMVFIHTNVYRPDLPQYFKNSIIQLPVPTSDNQEIVHYALIALRQIFREGYQYQKAGVIITEITKCNAVQTNIFDTKDRDKSKRLMETFDKINSKYGKKTIQLAVEGSGQEWKMRQKNLSPCYTTRMKDILTIKV